MIAVIDGVWVMAVKTIKITALQEDDQTIAWSIYAGKI